LLVANAEPPRSLPSKLFSIQEQFGVTHPPQIIDFDFGKRIDQDRSYMIGPQGMEVPFQLLHDGKIAVEAALPANSPRGVEALRRRTGPRAP
jgi:hypothetical protein